MQSGESSHRTKGLLRLTMACNERCPFCNVPMEDYPRPTPPQAEIDAQLAAFEGDTLTISGGEPTLLRKRLVALVRAARERGIPYVELQTNAILIDEGYATELAEAGLTSAFVSLLSHVPELHDELAGKKGAFPRCVRGIKALSSNGVRVTLNPVTAFQTQSLLGDYIDFVAAELPGVSMISVSAVQPHGRGRDNLDLLPDYAVLADAVRAARVRADAHQLDLVNPYCGLPACIGWEDDLDRCVEAFEAERGGWQNTPGIDNRGNKSHGEPCNRCALRPRCGGAWHAYWTHRGGSGIRAPIEITEPWNGDNAAQQVVRAPGGPNRAVVEALRAATSPTVWLWTDTLGAGDADTIARTGCTNLALELATIDVGPTLSEARKLASRLHLGLRGKARELHKGALLASRLGVPATILGPADPRLVAVLGLPHVEAPRPL